jgi:hypothetical protein
MLFATNDTDVLKTGSALRVNNDLGLNVKMSEQFATRISYLSEFNDPRGRDREQTGRIIGLFLLINASQTASGAGEIRPACIFGPLARVLPQ